MNTTYKTLQAKLNEQRAMLLAELAEAASTPDTGIGYSNHQADDATQAFEQAADLAIRTNAKRLLYQVEQALCRMDEGTYGLCQECGLSIDRARLDAIPYTCFCMDCASRHEEG